MFLKDFHDFTISEIISENQLWLTIIPKEWQSNIFFDILININLIYFLLK